jgi:hypothetical protein
MAVRTQCSAQGRDLKLQVLCRYYDARPHPAHELLFRDERAVGLQQDQQEVEGAPAELDWNAVGEQLSPSQENAEAAEF